VLREDELPIRDDVEDAVVAPDQLRLDPEVFRESGRQTGGPRVIVSTHAVGDGDLHDPRMRNRARGRQRDPVAPCGSGFGLFGEGQPAVAAGLRSARERRTAGGTGVAGLGGGLVVGGQGGEAAAQDPLLDLAGSIQILGSDVHVEGGVLAVAAPADVDATRAAVAHGDEVDSRLAQGLEQGRRLGGVATGQEAEAVEGIRR
jgi:hypothetical protein